MHINLKIGTRKMYRLLTDTYNHYDIWIDVLQYATHLNTQHGQHYIYILLDYNKDKPFTIHGFSMFLGTSSKTTERAFKLWMEKGIIDKIIINGEQYYKIVNYLLWVENN